jgi:DNA-binding transcriptional LysR family regulator
MDLRTLRYFLIVAEELHFSRAAERLGMERSPLSRQIRNLEIELGARLFHRQRRLVSLTAAGESLRADARRILADLDAAVATTRALASGRAPFRLGVTEAAAAPVLGRLLRLCRESDPPILVQIIELPLTDLAVMVDGGALEAALILSPPKTGRLKCHVTWRDRFMLFVPPRHDLARRREVSWSDLGSETWVLPDPTTLRGLAAQTEALLAQASISPREILRAAHTATILGLVASGAGVALLPSLLGAPSADIVRLPLDDPRAEALTYMIYRENDHTDVLQRVRAHAAAAGQLGGSA